MANASRPRRLSQLIESRAREAYARREIEYPVDHVLALAFGREGQTRTIPTRPIILRSWVRAKYGIEMSLEHIRATRRAQLARRVDRIPGEVSPRRQARRGDRADGEGQRAARALKDSFTRRFGALM